jgi:hypothetical protein
MKTGAKLMTRIHLVHRAGPHDAAMQHFQPPNPEAATGSNRPHAAGYNLQRWDVADPSLAGANTSLGFLCGMLPRKRVLFARNCL